MSGGWYMVSPDGAIGFTRRRRWSDRRSRRANLRRCGAQVTAREEIVAWLTAVLGDDGTVTGWEHEFADDDVTVRLAWRGIDRRLRFGPLQAWPNIVRREVVASEVLEVLGEHDSDEVALGWIAEEEWLERGEWRAPVRRRGLRRGRPGVR